MAGIPNIEKLTETRKLVKTLLDCLNEVVDNNIPLTQAARNYDLDVLKLNMLFKSKGFTNCTNNPITMPDDVLDKFFYDPYKELYKNVFGFDDIEFRAFKLPIDYIESVDYALMQLTEREGVTICLRLGLPVPESFGKYEDTVGESMKLDDVGKIFDVTRERVRQIEARGYRHLRHISATNGHLLKYGKAFVEKSREIKRVETELALDKYKADLQEHLDNERLAKLAKASHPNELSEISLSDVNKHFALSIRTYNALRRAQLDNLEAIMNASDNELLKVRNLGKRSLKEVWELKQAVKSGELDTVFGICTLN